MLLALHQLPIQGPSGSCRDGLDSILLTLRCSGVEGDLRVGGIGQSSAAQKTVQLSLQIPVDHGGASANTHQGSCRRMNVRCLIFNEFSQYIILLT